MLTTVYGVTSSSTFGKSSDGVFCGIFLTPPSGYFDSCSCLGTVLNLGGFERITAFTGKETPAVPNAEHNAIESKRKAVDQTSMSRPETDSGNGAHPRAFADIPDTGEHLLTMAGDIDAQGDGVAHLIKVFDALLERRGHGGGGGGDGGGPPLDVKKFRKGNWLAQIAIAVLMAITTGYGGYRVLQSTVAEHGDRIGTNEQAIDANARGIAEVKISVDDVGEKMDQQYRVQVQLVDGIDQLTAEAQTDKQKRLEDELEQLRRENRRLGGSR